MQVLVEELVKQLSQLETDSNPFYSPDTFFVRSLPGSLILLFYFIISCLFYFHVFAVVDIQSIFCMAAARAHGPQ